MATLNRRFEHGRPSKDIGSAGVIARLFDPSEDPKEPWRPCSNQKLWCKVYGDRMPASIINKRVPWLYSKGDSALAGFLIAPQTVSLYCAYSGDGSTMNKMCEPPGLSSSCMPGCPLGHDDTNWCSRRDEGNQCAWRANQLDQVRAPLLMPTRLFYARRALSLSLGGVGMIIPHWALTSGPTGPSLITRAWA